MPSKGDRKMIGSLNLWKIIKDFSNAVIDCLVPSTPRSQQAPIFRTDGEVLIRAHN